MAFVNLQKGSLKLEPGLQCFGIQDKYRRIQQLYVSQLAATHYNPKSYLTPPKEMGYTVVYIDNIWEDTKYAHWNVRLDVGQSIEVS